MFWDDSKFIAFDYETSGTKPEYALQPWRVAQGKAWATSFVTARVTANGPDIRGGLNPTVDMMVELLKTAIREKRTIVGWNTIFDVSWLLAYGLHDLVFKAKWLDGMLLWRHAFIEPEYEVDRPNKKTYGLKSCVAEILPNLAGYEEDIDFHSEDPEARRKLHEYNVRDTLFTLWCARYWYNKLTPRQRNAALLEAQCIPFVAQANLDGMLVDTLATHELDVRLQATAARQLEKLAPDGITEKIVRSPIQLARVLFDDWHLPVLKENVSKKTGKTSRSTDKEVLHELAFKDPRAKELRTYREALGNRTKFATALLESGDYNEDRRTHPGGIVFGTYSGRMTYASKQGKGVKAVQTGFALHQEKRGAEFRNVIIAPPGYTLMEFDASGQEFRWMAEVSEDPTMRRLCQPGEDPHSYMGSRVYQMDYLQLMQENKEKINGAPDKRQLGKVGNLSLQYRTSARKFRSVARVQYDIPIEMPEAQRIRQTYLNTYTRVPVYWGQQIAQTKTCGYVETLAGRRVQVVGNWDGDFGWSMGSTSINYRIQGTGADQKYLAIAVIKDYAVAHGIKFAWDLHDGLYWWVPDAQVERAAHDIKYLLDNLPYKKAWGFQPNIPFPWDCKFGKSWGALKEFRYA